MRCRFMILKGGMREFDSFASERVCAYGLVLVVIIIAVGGVVFFSVGGVISPFFQEF